MKIRYTLRHNASGKMEVKTYTLKQLEENTLKSLSPCFVADYTLVAKEFSNGENENGEEIFSKIEF